jgi:sorbitol-specific phosphotransferase system component IIA
MLTKIKQWVSGVDKNAPDMSQPYSIVEKELKDGGVRQGIRIHHGKYAMVVVTTSPRVELKVDEQGLVNLTFDFTVEYTPHGLVIDHKELHAIVGNCIVDIISKDFDENRDIDSECVGEQ